MKMEEAGWTCGGREGRRNICNISVGKPEGKGQLG